jgi:hypothetical protein
MALPVGYDFPDSQKPWLFAATKALSGRDSDIGLLPH